MVSLVSKKAATINGCFFNVFYKRKGKSHSFVRIERRYYDSNTEPQFKQLVGCISSFGWGKTGKRFICTEKAPNPHLKKSLSAFPQFRRGLALVTLFPLPLRPEKQV